MRPNSFPKPESVGDHPDGWSGGGLRQLRADRSVSAEMEAIFSTTAGVGAARQGQGLLAPGNHVRTISVTDARPQSAKRVKTGALLGVGALALLIGSAWFVTLSVPTETAPASETNTMPASSETRLPRSLEAPALTISDAPLSSEQAIPVAPNLQDPVAPAIGDPVSIPLEARPNIVETAPAQANAPAASMETPVVNRAPPIEGRRPSVDRVYRPPVIAIPSEPDPEIALPAEVAEPRPRSLARTADPIRRGSDRSSGAAGGVVTPAALIKGRLKNSDYPRAARKAGAEGTVHVRFLVNPDGGVGGCTVTRSSGNAELDGTTCRLIERRFRYKPARDARGRPTSDVIVGEQLWWIKPGD